MQDVNNLVKELFGIGEDTVMETAVDVGFVAIPVVGNLYRKVKMRKFELRIKENYKQVQEIKNKIEQKENAVFYKQEVFPLIVRHLIEDEEDEKAKVIIDGFQHVVDQDIEELERIYHYYDILEQMRFSDLVYLFKKYEHQYTGDPATFKVPDYRFRRYEESDDERERRDELYDINFYQLNKFARLTLTTEPEHRELQSLQAGELTRFGVRFFDFFLSEDD
ncbi:hypothetical protein GLW08_12640 [Pontibacillus yanchengensis]|uniref:Uncharacterized protein n=1 Tax=Pontibacillus yanchengensis TaxID=462910 RepID=A0ACC7VHL9_9BACI|nr:hypothetical protein [Pontibacillus yanchengensis]MYL54185.1 hypothetical protein [Pontibacillus yanchengensis]